MEKQVILITIGVLFLILMVLIAINLWPQRVFDEQNKGPQLFRCPTYTGGKIMSEMYSKMNFNLTDNPQLADVYLPCGYTWVEKELQKYTPTGGQVILAIDGCDKIVAKNGLWKVLSDEYGRDGATKFVPQSYISNLKLDLDLLRAEYNPQKIYILKKNVQRQQGLKITRDLEEMLSCAKQGYAIIQEYLMNPLLFDKRKFDIRVYLLVIQKGNMQYYYRHTGGRCHYTSRNFTTLDLEKDIHIPSGYNEDKLFKASHPETLKQLQEYMNIHFQNGGDIFFQRLDEMLNKCCHAFYKVLGTDQKFVDHNTVCCQLFGLDFLCDVNLHPVLIEINKGPEMSWNSDIEKEYKNKVVADMFNLLGYLEIDSPNEFIPLFSAERSKSN